jgi:hypothetical protein
MVYPGLSQLGPYIQQLMILILKSTQNQGLSMVLILRLPHRRWSLPPIGEEEDDRMRWKRGSRCLSLGCLALCVERRWMEWNGVFGDQIGILPL